MLNRVQQIAISELKYSVSLSVSDNKEDQIWKSSDEILHFQHIEHFFWSWYSYNVNALEINIYKKHL